MHASQVSSSGASAYQPVYSQRKTRGTDEAAPAQAVERHRENHRHHRSEGSERSDDSRPARNPLVNAMMEALKGLTQGAEASATSPAKDVSTAAVKNGDAPKSVKEAALNFANELYSALRAAGESSGAAAPKKTGYGDSGGGYGDLVQGLKRLAQSIAAPAKIDGAAPAAASPTPVSAAAPKPVSAPVSVAGTAPAPALTAAPAVSQPVAAAPAPQPGVPNPETPKPSAPVPVAASASSTSASRSPITINITFNFVNSTAIGASKASTTSAADGGKSAGSTTASDSPLLKAFKDLMAALNGDSAEGGAAIDNDKAIEMLQGFLQKIAESLGGDAAAQTPEAALPAKGSLISVTA